MRVTVCQLDTTPAGLPAALDALHEHVRSESPDLVLLPELGLSPWLPATRDVDADAWWDSIRAHEVEIDRWCATGIPAVGTHPVVEDGARRNAAFSLDPTSRAVIDRHTKHYLPDEPGYWEASWYEPGPAQFDAFDHAGARIGVQICTEMWFFEWARHYARAGVDLLCVPRATPHASTDRWVAGGRAAAVCSGAYCLSSNQHIPGGSDLDHGGVGWIIDPDGAVLALTSDDTPFVSLDIDLAAARDAKSTYPRYVIE